MAKDNFDDHIRDLLRGVEEDYDDTSWSKLNERLDNTPPNSNSQSTSEEDHKIIKQKLENTTVDVPEAHWESLKEELEAIKDRKERLYIVKLLELTIVALLVMTYFNYKWYSADIPVNEQYIDEIFATLEDPSQVEATLEAETPITISQEQLAKVTNVSILTTKKSIVPSSFVALSQGSTFIDGTKLQSFEVIEDFSNKAIPLQVWAGQLTLAVLPIDFALLDNAIVADRTPVKVITEIKKEKGQFDGWSIGTAFTYDVNFVNTDLNLGFLNDQIESGLGGFSFGLSTGYRLGAIELESGFRYGEKTFIPGKLTNYSKSSNNSFLESQLEEMTMKQVQIPFVAKAYFNPKKKLNFYVAAGGAANFLLENEYRISRTVQPKVREALAPAIDLVDLKSLPKAILDGGGVANNYYTTAVIGFGVQAQMKNGVAWYLQPQYQHSFASNINEIVTNINALNIEGGLKFSF